MVRYSRHAGVQYGSADNATTIGATQARRGARAASNGHNTPGHHLNAIATPNAIRFVNMLPKTRSGKVMRRVIRAVYQGDNIGDLSTIEDDATVDMVREAVDLLNRDL